MQVVSVVKVYNMVIAFWTACSKAYHNVTEWWTGLTLFFSSELSIVTDFVLFSWVKNPQQQQQQICQISNFFHSLHCCSCCKQFYSGGRPVVNTHTATWKLPRSKHTTWDGWRCVYVFIRWLAVHSLGSASSHSLSMLTADSSPRYFFP